MKLPRRRTYADGRSWPARSRITSAVGIPSALSSFCSSATRSRAGFSDARDGPVERREILALLLGALSRRRWLRIGRSLAGMLDDALRRAARRDRQPETAERLSDDRALMLQADPSRPATPRRDATIGWSSVKTICRGSRVSPRGWRRSAILAGRRRRATALFGKNVSTLAPPSSD